MVKINHENQEKLLVFDFLCVTRKKNGRKLIYLQCTKHQFLWETTLCLQQDKFAIRTHLQFEINVNIMQNQFQSFLK